MQRVFSGLGQGTAMVYTNLKSSTDEVIRFFGHFSFRQPYLSNEAKKQFQISKHFSVVIWCDLAKFCGLRKYIGLKIQNSTNFWLSFKKRHKSSREIPGGYL